jgi:hypothetical protein
VPGGVSTARTGRGSAGKLRALVSCLAAVVLAVAAVAPAARADADPASDVLLVQDIFLPYGTQISEEAVRGLQMEVAKAKAAGYHVKVAIIGSRTDLGGVPTFFGKPRLYARFLGFEITPSFKGPLLVVMPGGLGFFQSKRATDREDRALSTIKVAPGGDGLASTAIAAIKRLSDRKPPAVKALASSARRGRASRLRYTVSDDSGTTQQQTSVYLGRRRIAAFQGAYGPATGKPIAASWRVPRSLRPGRYTFCVRAKDLSGNLSAQSCASLRIG